MTNITQARSERCEIVHGPCPLYYPQGHEMVSSFAAEHRLDLDAAWRDLNHQVNFHMQDEEFLAVTVDGRHYAEENLDEKEAKTETGAEVSFPNETVRAIHAHMCETARGLTRMMIVYLASDVERFQQWVSDKSLLDHGDDAWKAALGIFAEQYAVSWCEA